MTGPKIKTIAAHLGHRPLPSVPARSQNKVATRLLQVPNQPEQPSQSLSPSQITSHISSTPVTTSPSIAPPADEPWRTISPRGRALRMPATVLSLARCHGPSHRARAALTPPYPSGRTAAVEGSGLAGWGGRDGALGRHPSVSGQYVSQDRRGTADFCAVGHGKQSCRGACKVLCRHCRRCRGASERISTMLPLGMSPAEFNLTWPLDESLVVSGHLIKTTTAPPTSKSFHIPPPSAIPGTCLPRLAAKHHHHKATPPPPSRGTPSIWRCGGEHHHHKRRSRFHPPHPIPRTVPSSRPLFLRASSRWLAPEARLSLNLSS